MFVVKKNSTYYNLSNVSYFSFQPVFHDWFNKGRGMCYPACGMMHIKEPLLLIGKSSLCSGSGFTLSLFVWSFNICLTQHNRNVIIITANRCSSVVECRRIDPSWCIHWAIFPSSQYITTGLTIPLYVLSCLWDGVHLIEKTNPCRGGSEFPFLISEWFFTIGPTPYKRN